MASPVNRHCANCIGTFSFLVTPSLFHSRLKTFSTNPSYQSLLFQDWLHGLHVLLKILLSISFLIYSFYSVFWHSAVDELNWVKFWARAWKQRFVLCRFVDLYVDSARAYATQLNHVCRMAGNTRWVLVAARLVADCYTPFSFTFTFLRDTVRRWEWRGRWRCADATVGVVNASHFAWKCVTCRIRTCVHTYYYMYSVTH